MRILCLGAACLKILSLAHVSPIRTNPTLLHSSRGLASTVRPHLLKDNSVLTQDSDPPFHTWLRLSDELTRRALNRQKYRSADFYRQLGQAFEKASRTLNPAASTSGEEQKLKEALEIIFLAKDFSVDPEKEWILTEDPTQEFLFQIFGSLREEVPHLTLFETAHWIERLLHYARQTTGIETPEDIFFTIRNIKSQSSFSEFKKTGRKGSGVGWISHPLPTHQPLLWGTDKNAGLITQDVGNRLVGREFRNFSDFRAALWKAVSDSKHRQEFSQANQRLIANGKAPLAGPEQALEKENTYQLHHIHPLHRRGALYDAANLMIVTPRFHKEVLCREIHYREHR